jgi:hypothetical protein
LTAALLVDGILDPADDTCGNLICAKPQMKSVWSDPAHGIFSQVLSEKAAPPLALK